MTTGAPVAARLAATDLISPEAVTALLAGAGLALLPASSGAARRLRWLAARRWPGRSSTTRRPTAKLLGRLPAVARQPAIPTLGSAGLVGAFAGPVPGLLAGLTALVLGYCWRQVHTERALTAETAALAEAVSAILAEHAAGATLGAALSRAAPSAGRHQVVLHQAGRLATLGQQPAAALAGRPALDRIAVAAALIGRAGVGVATVLNGVHTDLRAEQRVRAAVAEAVTSARSAAMLLTALPAAGLVMGVALGAHPQRVLLHTSAGLGALTAGVLLNLTGLCWVLRLTRPVRPRRAAPPSASAPSASAPPASAPSASASPSAAVPPSDTTAPSPADRARASPAGRR